MISSRPCRLFQKGVPDMERYTTARRGTAWPIFLPGGWATIGRAIAVAATLLGTTPVVSARGVQQQGEAREPVEPNSPSEFMAILPSGESVQVYPCARNRATDAITKHCYLYLPPLTLERDSDGRVLASETPSGGVSIRMIGNSQHLTNGVHAWLADEDMLPDARRPGSAFVGPFPYHQIRVLDADHGPDVRWHAVALSTDEGSVAQEWITFVFTPLAGVSESPAEFIERLNDPDRLPSLRAVLSYGGRTVVVNSLSLTASMLRGTNFLVDLKGDGGRDLVTRNQARDLLLTYATYVTQITYTESPDQVTVNPGWLFDSLFKVVVISAEDFWADAQYLLRVGFSDKDLLPDTHRQMLVQTAWELLNEEDTHFSKAVSEYWRRGESKTEGSYEGSMPLVGSAKASFSRTAPRDDGGEAERLEKAEFLKSLESEDSLFEWDGEVIVPKDVVLYQLDEAQLDSETELASISVTTVRSTASLGYTIYNSPWMVSDVASLDFARLLWVADQGNVSAQTELGSRYENGRGGVRQDDSDAAYWSRRAAGEGEGNARAMTNLGVMYRQGRGVQKDDAEAARWFLPAAEHGNAIAQTNLGDHVHARSRGRAGRCRSRPLVPAGRRAGKRVRAMTDLGLLYAEGRGVRQDESEAVHWVRQAAEQGDARALAVLGVMYEHGLGVRQDDAEAVGLLLLAAEQGDADAQYQPRPSVQRTVAGCGRTMPKPPAGSSRPPNRENDLRAAAVSAYLYALKGLGVRQDDAEAARWYRRAAEQGIATGQYSLGLMYEDR